jgi:hypothetical protein
MEAWELVLREEGRMKGTMTGWTIDGKVIPEKGRR